MAKKLPIVEVVWEDSCASGGWRDAEAYLQERTAECRTSGYLLRADRKQVTLIQSLHPAEKRMADSMSIPRSVVKSITRLEGKRA